MGLTFIDDNTLVAKGTATTYSLLGFRDDVWQYITGIEGTDDGTTDISCVWPKVTQLSHRFGSGETYLFKWIDGYGSVSNARSVRLPSAPVLADYAMGSAEIDMDIRDDGQIVFSFYAGPDGYRSMSSANVVYYSYKAALWQNGKRTMLKEDSKLTHDYDLILPHSGTGVYELQCWYTMSNGCSFAHCHLIKVDAEGRVLDRIGCNGSVADKAGDMTLIIAPDIIPGKTHYPMIWGVQRQDKAEMLTQTDEKKPITLPADARFIFLVTTFGDSKSFYDYRSSGFLAYYSVVIAPDGYVPAINTSPKDPALK